jgi:hypothetical protein
MGLGLSQFCGDLFLTEPYRFDLFGKQQPIHLRHTPPKCGSVGGFCLPVWIGR